MSHLESMQLVHNSKEKNHKINILKDLLLHPLTKCKISLNLRTEEPLRTKEDTILRVETITKINNSLQRISCHLNPKTI